MKALQCNSPKSNKLNKRISLADPSHTKSKETQRNQNQEFGSPIHIKLEKNKPKDKKESKTQKQDPSISNKRTKRKQNKKPVLELNSTIVINDCIEKKNTKRQPANLLRTKTKTTEKTNRPTFKSQQKKLTANQWFIELEQKSTVGDLLEKKKKKNKTSKQDLPLPNHQQYLFIGDQFFLVNNLNPTKRLLNTFRENCKKDQPDSKFIAQDKKDRSKQARLEKKTNIFTEARRELELNYKISKATIIQRWWRKCLSMKNIRKDSPQYVQPQHQVLNNTQSKISFKENEEQDGKKFPFQVEKFNTSPINGKIPNFEDSFIVSFNSADKLEEESRPKKIAFTKEDFSKLIAPTYKLPEAEVNADENEAVFSNCSKFKIQQPNILDVSSDNAEIAQKQKMSPQKTRQQAHYQSKIKEQWSPNKLKVADPRYEILKELQEATRIKEQIEFRTSFQKGMIKPLDTYNSKIGISTSILAIHTFLVKFFNFYIQNYQDQFISLINMPYGNSIPARLRQLQGYGLPEQVEQDDQGVVFGIQYIIDDQKLQQFYMVQGKQGRYLTNFAMANLQIQKIHNKAVLDLFNQLLNQYRPYKQLNGVPYPWNHSYKALTFYFVTQDNIAEVFEKVQLKILKESSLLAGIMLPLDQAPASQPNSQNFDTIQFMENYQKKFHPLLFQYNQEKQLRCAQQEVKNTPFEYNNEEITKILIQLSVKLCDELAIQTVQQLKSIKNLHFY